MRPLQRARALSQPRQVALRSASAWRSLVRLRGLSCCLVGLLALGCAGLSDDLRHARRSYAAAAYEDALTWLVAVEDEIPAASTAKQATWHYLRGMTEYRLGRRGEARHYLALAHVIAGERGVGLQPQWRRTLTITLDELGDELPGSREP